MKAFLLPTVFGIVLSTENGKILRAKTFKKPTAALRIYKKLEQGEQIPDILNLLSWAEEEGIDQIIVEDETLSRLAKDISKIEVLVKTPSQAGRAIRDHLYPIARKAQFRMSQSEFNDFRREVAIKLLRDQIQKISAKQDGLIIQAIENLDEVNKTINLFSSRIREWYGLHFPELNRKLTNHELIAKIIVFGGTRDKLTKKLLETDLGIEGDEATQIMILAEQSFGATLTEKDLHQIQSVAQRILDLFQQRREVEQYIEETIQVVAPNLQGLVGPLIAARLLSIAGGLERLSRMPSSTVQVLGAEKALFRAKKTGSRPPKHGILFQHNLVHSAKKWQRGKISRVLAGKLSIAARIDVFSDRDESQQLEDAVKERVDLIKEKYADAPKRVARPAPQRDHFRSRRKRYKPSYGQKRGRRNKPRGNNRKP